MEMKKCNIHISHLKAETEQLITIDDDFSLQSGQPEILAKIKECGYIVIDKVRPLEDRVAVNGSLKFKLLYQSDKGYGCMEETAPFEDTIVMNGVGAQDIARCTSVLEDLSITVVNSGKISVKAVICLRISAEEICDEQAVNELETDKLQTRSKKLNVMNLISSKKDICRIRESVKMPQDNKNAESIVWEELSIQNLELRAGDGEIALKGDMSIFCIYTAEKTGDPCYYDVEIPFTRKMDMDGCSENIIMDIATAVSHKSLVVRPDENGEMRILDGEIILDLDIRAYGEENYTIIQDAYSPACEMEFMKKSIDYREFNIKNSIKTKTEERFRLKDDEVSRIVHCDGRSNIEEITIADNNISIDGAITAEVLFFNSDNRLEYRRYELPFSEKMEIDQNKNDIVCQAREGTLGVSASVYNKNEIAIKCTLETELLVFNNRHCDIIENIDVQAADYEYIKGLPGIVGYIVKDGDTLWEIAKKNCTTVDSIKMYNNLDTDVINQGMKLMVVKEC